MEISEVGLPETFYEVFFDAAGGGDEAGDVFVFGEMEDDFAQAGGDEVGGVAEEDVTFYLRTDGGIAEFFVFVFGDGLVGQTPLPLNTVSGKLK